MERRRALVVIAAVAAWTATACAEPSPATDRPAGTPSSWVEGSGTVLQVPEGPAELCLGGVAESLPPQCSGIPLVGWDWDAVSDEQRANGVVWGEYHLTGSYDGTRFTVEEVSAPRYPGQTDDDPFATPCPEPEGGWVVDGAVRIGDEDQRAAARLAEAEPDFTALWIDQLAAEVVEGSPGPYVLNVGFTGDLQRHRAELADVWDGPLCVFRQARTYRELRRIQRELSVRDEGIEVLWSSVDVIGNRVEIGTVVSDAAFESSLDARYGEGAVRVVPALRPVS